MFLKSKALLILFIFINVPYAHAASESITVWTAPLDSVARVNLRANTPDINAFIDTGSHVSIIDEAILGGLGVSVTDESLDVYLPAVGRIITIFRTEPFEMKLPDTSISLTISPLVYPENISSDPEFAGISGIILKHGLLLGMEDLSQLKFDIDYRKKTTTLTKLAVPSNVDKNIGISIDFKTLVSDVIIDCTVDTGAEPILGIFIQSKHPEYSRLKSKFQNLKNVDQPFSSSDESLMTHDPTGQISGLLGSGFLVEFELTAENKEEGDKCYIGPTILEHVQITKTNATDIHNNGKLPEVIYNRIGTDTLTYNPKDDIFFIGDLFDHGALSQAGIKKGDTLISIGGVTAKRENFALLKSVTRQASGQKLKVVIQRKSSVDTISSPEETFTVTLTDFLANAQYRE